MENHKTNIINITKSNVVWGSFANAPPITTSKAERCPGVPPATDFC